MRKTALVTGASGGFGREFARLLAQDDVDLVLVARSTKKLEALKKELQENHKVSVTVISKDLSKLRAADEVMAVLKRKKIHVDVLINNAGFGLIGPFLESDVETETNMILLNVNTLTRLAKLCAIEMVRRKRGWILNVSSTAGFLPGPFMAVYYATKAYVLSFSQALRDELRGTGVSVTTLCPGPSSSGFGGTSGADKKMLFSSRNKPSAREVATFGYRALTKRKNLAIHGFWNKYILSGWIRSPSNF